MQHDPIISRPSEEDLLFLVLNLRQTDREETFETLILDPVDAADHLHAALVASVGTALFCELYSDPDTGKPFALAFITPTTLTSATFNFLCTSDVTVAMTWLTREVTDRLEAVMRAYDLLRVECRARDIISHVKWLQLIGAHIECRVPGYSRHGFVQAAWTLEDQR